MPPPSPAFPAGLRFVWVMLLLAVPVLAMMSTPARADEATGAITGFSLSRSQNTTRAQFAVPEDVQYHIFTLSNPDRVVVDFLNARPADGLDLDAAGDPLISDIRAAPRFDGKGERLVFDLRQSVTPQSHLLGNAGNAELVVTFGNSANASPSVQAAISAIPKPADKPAADAPPAQPVLKPVMTAAQAQPQRLRDVVIAIDAGHGGRDSGAVGPDGLEEKNVTLAIAKDLYAILSRVPGIKPVLTRTGDYYVSLNGRREIAHEDHADLFISIHADSSPYHYPKGSSVYVLSEHGASSVAARILAETENSSDEVAGVNLSQEEPMVRSTILNLSQSGTLIRSMQLADAVMDKINDALPMHSDKVERAAFVVLKSPDIPSILVETAFISNRTQEQELASSDFRDRIAGMIASGIEDYAEHYAPPGTLIAARRDALNTLKQG